MENWNKIHDENGNIHVPQELAEFANTVATQIRFCTISGKDEGQTVCDIVAAAQSFFSVANRSEKVWSELITLEKEHKRDRGFWVNVFKTRIDEQTGTTYEDEGFGSYCYFRLVGIDFDVLKFIRADKNGQFSFSTTISVGEASEILFRYIDNVLKEKQLALFHETKDLPY